LKLANAAGSPLFSATISVIVICVSSAAFAQCDRNKQQQAINALGMQVKVRLGGYQVPSSIEGQIAQRSSSDPDESALAAIRTIADVYCVSDDDDFAIAGTRLPRDDLGPTDVIIHQTFRGIQVIGPSLTVHLTHDSVTSIWGSFRPGIRVPTDPLLTTDDALRIALQFVAKQHGVNGVLKQIRGPVVFVDDRDKPRLSYPVRVAYWIDSKDRYVGGRHLDDIFVSAMTGRIVGVIPLIHKDP
jgi:Zn-dependent metalloprotease